MNYLGIVGALSSLGQGVISILEKYPSEYKIVFKVDDRYPRKDLIKGEFQNLEQVLSHGINPSLVLDFGVSDKMFERAKFYRDYEMPAIMQAIFGDERCHVLENSRGLSQNSSTPLILIPEFSVIKVSMVNNLKVLSEYLAHDVKRIHIDVLYNTERYVNFNQWLYWAYQLNELLGEHTKVYRQDGCTLTCGYVHYGFMKITSMEKNEENIHVQVITDDNDVPFRCEARYNLLRSRVDGVMKTLRWYLNHCKGKTLVGAENNLLKDTLSTLI